MKPALIDVIKKPFNIHNKQFLSYKGIKAYPFAIFSFCRSIKASTIHALAGSGLNTGTTVSHYFTVWPITPASRGEKCTSIPLKTFVEIRIRYLENYKAILKAQHGNSNYFLKSNKLALNLTHQKLTQKEVSYFINFRSRWGLNDLIKQFCNKHLRLFRIFIYRANPTVMVAET